jgi:Alpha amylase, catalytic domain
MFGTLAFWLDRGVDGFRLDAVNTLFEDPELRDNPPLCTPRVARADQCNGTECAAAASRMGRRGCRYHPTPCSGMWAPRPPIPPPFSVSIAHSFACSARARRFNGGGINSALPSGRVRVRETEQQSRGCDCAQHGRTCAAATVLSRALTTFLFEVESTDPPTLAGVGLLFGVVALPACWMPTHRAAQIDPLEALRSE